VRRVFVSDEWEQAAEALLAQYADHPFSYVDATSFIAMRRLGLAEAFTYDHHFLVSGFRLVGA
jgi:predicted nucleic acid-binding protein